MTDEAAPAPDWAAIRDAYEDRKLKVSEIARTFGVSQQSIYRPIDGQDWERRHAGAAIAKRRAAIRRLSRLVSRELTALEAAANAAVLSALAGLFSAIGAVFRDIAEQAGGIIALVIAIVIIVLATGWILRERYLKSLHDGV